MPSRCPNSFETAVRRVRLHPHPRHLSTHISAVRPSADCPLSVQTLCADRHRCPLAPLPSSCIPDRARWKELLRSPSPPVPVRCCLRDRTPASAHSQIAVQPLSVSLGFQKSSPPATLPHPRPWPASSSD